MMYQSHNWYISTHYHSTITWSSMDSTWLFYYILIGISYALHGSLIKYIHLKLYFKEYRTRKLCFGFQPLGAGQATQFITWKR